MVGHTICRYNQVSGTNKKTNILSHDREIHSIHELQGCYLFLVFDCLANLWGMTKVSTQAAVVTISVRYIIAGFGSRTYASDSAKKKPSSVQDIIQDCRFIQDSTPATRGNEIVSFSNVCKAIEESFRCFNVLHCMRFHNSAPNPFPEHEALEKYDQVSVWKYY
jgi:hypothetical protein